MAETYPVAMNMPGATNRDIAFRGLPDAPEDLLHETLYPDDAYKGTTYWADLPAKERTKWIQHQYASETGREFGVFWSMFKKEPLKPFTTYFRNYVVTGLGFFVEGYVLFSVGNINTLFESVWPSCYKRYQVCNRVWVQASSYLEIVGIIAGQIMIGFIGDYIGRRWGIIQDAVTMTIGSILLMSMWGPSLEGWAIMYAWSLFVFGVGVGGEYPMTSTIGMEGVHGEGSARADKLHRGRSVLLAFLMQGWGQLINQGVLIILLLIFHGGGNPPYGTTASQATFRVSFAFIVVFLLMLVYIRVFKLKDVDQTSKASKSKSKVTGYDVASLKLVGSHYYGRLFATSVGWVSLNLQIHEREIMLTSPLYCNDFPFYGNQIFRNVFLALVTSNSNQVITLWLYNLINVGCELVGYHLAALLVDHKQYGRKRMQMVGFTMTFVLFIIAAGAFPVLNVKGPGGHAFEFIYFFSSFWIQFGSNSTTFLLAAEVYPAPVRATAHGFSAAIGKCGALTATVLYNYIGQRTKFWVVSWFGLIGAILTFVFIPDTTGLDLREQERYWQYVLQGRAQDYHGIAVHPRHLSLYERLVLKRHKAYDPELDRKAKIDELRELYTEMNRDLSAEKEGRGSVERSPTLVGVGSGESDKISQYFDWEKSTRTSRDGLVGSKKE